MSIESTIQSALGTLVSGRCYPMMAPDGTAAPYIVYSVVSDVMVNTLDGYNGQSNKRVQSDIYATGYGAAKTLAESVKSAMAASALSNVHLSSQDLYEPDPQLYRISMDFSVWSKP